MKHKALSLALVLAALTAPLFPQTARANVEVSFDYFQDALSPFGEWIEVGNYGLCWRPTGVGEDWAPYTDGYWAYTDAGWTWVSYEDWGGITYHYGRWVHVRDEGWVWVPEYEWAPAWVSWRSNNDYVGWAPLPPEARWEPEIGFSTWVDTSYDIGPDNYRFCHTRDFGSPFLAPVLLPWERNVTIIQNTVNVTNISFYREGTVIFNGGPNFVEINRHCRRPIPALNLVREDHFVRDEHGRSTAQFVQGNQLAVYAPKVARPADIRALPVKPQKVIASEKVDRGWGRVADPAAQKELRKKLGAQSAGLTPATAPARPPRPQELSSIIKKADPNANPTRVLGKNKPPRGADGVPNTPQVSPLAGQPIPPKREKPIIDPRAPADAGSSAVKVPQVSVPEQARKDRPANPVKPFQAQPQTQPQPLRKSQRPPQADAVQPAPSQPQTAAADESARAEEKALRRQQRDQQAAAEARENAQRAADSTRRQQEAAQRSNELRQQSPQPPRPKVQQADPARQQQQVAQRANELRNEQAQQQRQQARQAEAARQSQEAAQRANEMRSQQVQQQRQQARQADAMRQQQEASQRSNEMRMQQAQQARQFEAARQQQHATQRANEMRQQQPQPQRQQPQQFEVRRQQPPQQQAQQPAQPSRPTSKDGDDEKKKNRGR